MTKDIARLRIQVPDPTTNYITNPSVRFDTTGWTAFSSTISRTLDFARFGISSLKVITTGSLVREGFYFRVNALLGISEPITVSAYVRGSGKIQIRLTNGTGGQQWTSKPVFLSASRWQRIEVTGRSNGTNDVRLYVESAEATAKVLTFYVDGAQMERKAYSTSYCDGDQPGCRWNIIQSASISTRDASTREGGRWVTLVGREREEENLYATVMGGLGMAPIENNTDSFAVAPGGYFKNSKITERIITMTFHAKHVDLLGKDKAITLTYLHQLRQFLIDAVKPDLTDGDQDFLMEYLDGDLPLYFRARYDGGLEGDWDIRNRFFNSFPLRLLVVSPMITEDSQEIAIIDFQESFILNNIGARYDGRWNNMNYGFNDQVIDIELGRKGEIYVSGDFTIANNSASAVSPLIPVNYISYWDGTQFQKLGIGANSTITDIAVAPNGYLYVTGSFTSIGGVAASRVAYWDGSAWNAMGAGLGAAGSSIAVAPNGDVYVGGTFTTAGGINARRIARWNGSQWFGVGQYSGFANGSVSSIAISPDGTFMYVAGSFTDQFGIGTSSMLRVAYYDVLTDRFTQVGAGFNASVNKIIIAPSGTVYIGGSFTASGATSCNFIAQLSGLGWVPLGDGMDATVNSFDVAVNGDLVAVGSFETAGGIPMQGLALWNGSSWVNADIIPSIGSSTNAVAVLFTPSGELYVGGALGVTFQSRVAGITTVTNIGDAEVYPFVYILGPGTLRWLENQTTKKRVFFNLVILSGEEVFIDFEKGTLISTVRGDMSFTVLPGSDFSAFALAPGENRISTLITNDVNAVMRMGYTPTHWGMDESS